MKLFKCQQCGQILHFENRVCGQCQYRLGYVPERGTLYALEPDSEVWKLVGANGRRYRFCTNAEFNVCNWLVPIKSLEQFCLSCRHNRTIPDMTVEGNLPAWRKIEQAKHRLIYSILKLGLKLENRNDAPDYGLVFDFPAVPLPGSERVITGHDNGVITIALSEADDVEREKQRVSMHEPYRTLLGHFRHEVAHYFWDRLIRDGGRLDEFRAVFGDEQADYAAALQNHYANGPPTDWQGNYVTAYAAAHPWEDFAETWAHYLHMVDTLEMASAFGISIRPRLARTDALDAEIDFDPYRAADIGQLVDNWLPLTITLNSLNRAMGLADPYPFILSTPAIAKLDAIHAFIHGSPLVLHKTASQA
jgi:hypothetical protein